MWWGQTCTLQSKDNRKSMFSAEIWRSSESRCLWWMKVVSSRQMMELHIGRHASRAQSWWLARWAVKCQMNVRFVLIREGWCDDSGMHVNWCSGSCKSSQRACSCACSNTVWCWSDYYLCCCVCSNLFNCEYLFPTSALRICLLLIIPTCLGI